MTRASFGAAVLLAGATATGASTGASAGDVERGRQLAESWCAPCHVVGPEMGGGEIGPSFPSVASREGEQADVLRAWLVDPHPPMPNMSLTMTEIDDLASYIMSLRDAAAPAEETQSEGADPAQATGTQGAGATEGTQPQETAPGETQRAAPAAASPGGLAGDARRGLLLAERWCVACHVVAPDAAGGGDVGPAFETVANREGQTLGGITAWLFEPHPPMPDLQLSPAEFRDLAAHIMSLRDE